MNIRKPYVAGKFYPDDAGNLDQFLERVYNKEKDQMDVELAKKRIIGGISPHAGYMYSSYQAIHLFETLRKHSGHFDTFFIINPNHTGLGNEMAYDSNDYWDSPYGKIEVDKDFAKNLKIPVSDIEERSEHSGEVMIPLLKYFLDYSFKIAPVTITNQTSRNAIKLAEEIFDTNKNLKKNIFLIASSDFSHYVKPDVGEEKDQLVLDRIMQFDIRGVEQTIREHDISVCGYGPIMALMYYSKLVSKNPKTKILRRGNSGDVSPSDRVVDYISILFYED